MSALEFDILFGRLKPRERLIEDVLMQRFGAKRHAVRQRPPTSSISAS